MEEADGPKRRKRRRRKHVISAAEYKKRQLASVARWNKSHLRGLCIHLNTDKDAELIEYFYSQPNKTEFMRRLLREDLKKKRSS